MRLNLLYLFYNVWPFFVLSQLNMPNTIEKRKEEPRADKQNGYRGENVKRKNEI